MNARPAWPAAAAAFAGALLVYLATLAPSIGFIDAGELAAAAYRFGIPHPSGYPLFVLISGAWSRAVPMRPVLALNVLSAIWAATAVVVCFLVARRLLARAFARPPLVAALGSALLLAFSRTFWSSALAVEVHPLHAALALSALALALRAIGAPGGPGCDWRAFRPAAFVLGLAFANHLTSVQLVPALGIAWLAGVRGTRARLAGLLRLAPYAALGLLPYAYLPLRAAQDPALNWGDPSSLQRLIGHVAAREYGPRFLLGWPAFAASLRDFASALPAELGLGAALGAAGLIVALRRDRVAAFVLAAAFLTSAGVAAAYSIPDIGPYFFLAQAALALLAGYAVATLALVRPWAALLAAALAVGPLLVANRDVSERGDYLVEDFARNMFRSLAPGALVISYQWDHWVSPALYLQNVEGVRPDVLVLDKRLVQRGWYVEQLARRQPRLVRGAEPELRALLRAIEQADAAAGPELGRRVDAFLQAVVDTVSPERPVYVTLDVEDSFPAGYRQVPEGLALRLYRPERVPPPDAPVWDEFEYRPFARRDGWTDRLRQYYAAMLLGRGVFQDGAGQPGLAARYFERALAFDPSPSLRAQLLERRAQARRSAP